MNEEQATAIAAALNGEAWQSGGEVWLALIHRKDGSVVAISDEVVCTYRDEDALHAGSALQSILLTAGVASR